MTDIARAILDVTEERNRQVVMWGAEDDMINNSSYPHVSMLDKLRDYLLVKCSVLGEEYGEVCKARNDHDIANLREECVQVAAVAVAMIEGVDWFNQYMESVK